MSPRGIAVGGGGLMILILIVGMLFGIDPNDLNQLVNNAPVGAGPAAPDRPETADEARTREFSETVLGFTEDVWQKLFDESGMRYEPPKMVLFTDRVSTGCGNAPSAVGPFYCPIDRTLYLDPTFFDELEGKLGGSKAEFSQAYVMAHEVGHHVQNLLGYSDKVHDMQRKLPEVEGNKWSVRLELQADYLAGVWAHHGQQEFRFIEPGDIESAIKSANAIGDDRLQRNATGFTSPEKYTHGTSEQRIRWFRLGWETGDLSRLREIFEMNYDDL